MFRQCDYVAEDRHPSFSTRPVAERLCDQHINFKIVLDLLLNKGLWRSIFFPREEHFSSPSNSLKLFFFFGL